MKKYCLFIIFAVLVLAGAAQQVVAVKDEPRHHNVFENEYIRVLDVRINPRDTSQMHKHATPSVFIVLHPVKTGSQVIAEEQKATALFSPDPSISFEGFYKSPRVHRVWNEDTAMFHVMDIELLKKEYHSTEAPIQQDSCKLLFDAAPVRGYRFTTQAGATVHLQRKNPLLIVGLTDAAQPLQVNTIPIKKEGDFLFVPAGQAVQFTNTNQHAYSFAVLELK